MRISHWFVFQSVCACVALAAGYTGPEAASLRSSDVVTFSAREHKFEGPDQLPAGQTTIRLHTVAKNLINCNSSSCRMANLQPISPQP